MNLFGDENEAVEPLDEIFESTDFPDPVKLDEPKNSNVFLGHEDVEKNLLKLFNSNKFPHGIILSGPEGIGKFTFAYRLARFLLSQEISDPNQDALFGDVEVIDHESMALAQDHPVFSRVSSGGHSDLLVIERIFDESKNKYKAGVEVAEIRKVTPFLRMTSGEGGWRVVIINDADTMNRNAQNALLKILEEPPEHTVLILVTHRPGALIPTIRSRSRVFNFSPLSLDTMQTLLSMHGQLLSEEEVEALYGLSAGSIGEALGLLEEGGLDVLGRIIDNFKSYPDFSWPDIHVMAEDMARANNARSYDAFVGILKWVSKEMVNAKARGYGFESGPLSAHVFQGILGSELPRLVALNDNLHEHFERVEKSNLEKRVAVLKAFELFI